MNKYALALFAILLFFIPIASATYLQVENSTFIKANNETDGSTVSNVYTTLEVFTVPENISGQFSINFLARATDLTSVIQLWKKVGFD